MSWVLVIIAVYTSQGWIPYNQPKEVAAFADRQSCKAALSSYQAKGFQGYCYPR